jgi:hypothetical protein
MNLKRTAGVLTLLAGLAIAAHGQAGMGEMHQMPPAKKPIPSASLVITVDGKSMTYTLAQLQAMPQRVLGVRNTHVNAEESYAGVGVDDLLAKFGITLANGGAQRIYHSYVRAEGTDHYFVLYSASELQPTLHTGDAIIALTLNGKPLGEDGAFKIVVAGEQKPARWVRNLASLTLVTVQ